MVEPCGRLKILDLSIGKTEVAPECDRKICDALDAEWLKVDERFAGPWGRARNKDALAGELEAQRTFLESATSEASGSREAAQAQQQQAQEAVRAVAGAEQQAEQNRRGAMQLMTSA